ncbi:hypothetical protein, partial [Streptomyces sp. SM12]|uniref:hypothetical protein n=1 Tax=Streptomyces sp. SM12 TaxID=1071602 RepID=UPI0011B0DE0B
MTDTGRFPERGQLDQAGAHPGHPVPPEAPVPDAFPYPDAVGTADPEDREEEELLMPGAAGAWNEPVSTP